MTYHYYRLTVKKFISYKNMHTYVLQRSRCYAIMQSCEPALHYDNYNKVHGIVSSQYLSRFSLNIGHQNPLSSPQLLQLCETSGQHPAARTGVADAKNGDRMDRRGRSMRKMNSFVPGLVSGTLITTELVSAEVKGGLHALPHGHEIQTNYPCR